MPDYGLEIAAMEGHLFKLAHRLISFDPYPETQIVNPSLKVFANNWKRLSLCLDGNLGDCRPEQGEERVMIWLKPDEDQPQIRSITDLDLLVLKMSMEGLRPETVAKTAGVCISAINSALRKGLESGIILGPQPQIIRKDQLPTNDYTGEGKPVPDAYTRSRGFALQWHITQACDLHCRHCYDRTPCESLTLEQEVAILDSLYEFCNDHHVFGQVSFTGGNPLLHPNFYKLYQKASDRGFVLGILGNPASREEIESLIAVQPPAFYQMSLEGLEPHNDYIRGIGHYRRVFEFLDFLKDHDIYTKIMLTLTRDNMDQVIELGRLLQGRADVFTFNRLSLVGEGANLTMAEPADYRSFLERYIEAAQQYPVFDLKDNLFNIVLDENLLPLFGGCTGYGCGAAFNFVSVLATGEVHACRKFPSFIGDITTQSLTEIYHSKRAQRYRIGPEECSSCRLNLVCRGCLAAAYSKGLDVFTEKDPYCFLSDAGDGRNIS